jgi:hypothetical protein
VSDTFPWDRLPDEPKRWFTRFTAFRLAGAGRTIESVWRNEPKRSNAKRPSSTWAQRVKEFHWWDRAEAWDQHMTAQAEAALEAKWREQWMGTTELIGRLGEMERANPFPFFEQKTVTMLDKDGNAFEQEVWDFNWETVREYGHLVKKIGWDRNGRPVVEFHDKVQVARLIGQNLGLFKEQMDVTSGGKPLDTRSLSDEELAAIAAGSGGGAAE